MGKELFDNIPSKVGDLLSDVKNGKVGLPDLQRPFVWKDSTRSVGFNAEGISDRLHYALAVSRWV